MFKLKPYICTKSYKLVNSNFISYIENAITCDNYVLSGEISVLWQFIVDNQNYNDIFNYAKKHNLQNILKDFLSELKDNDIIDTDIALPKPKSNYLNFKVNRRAKAFNTFLQVKKNIFSYHNFLEDIALNLNYTCNLNCRHCCNFKDMHEQMNYEDAKRIVDEAYELGAYSITLTGGECTLNKDLIKIAKYIREKHLALKILTNGQIPADNDDIFNELVSLYPIEVQVSLYSMNPEIHDNLTTVKGSHQKLIKFINKLAKTKTHTNITCVQTSYNPQSHMEVEKFAKSVNAKFGTSCLFQFNPKNDNLNAKLSKEDIEQFYINTTDINNLREGCLYCTGGLDRIAVMPNLEVNPCNYCYYSIGNLHNTTLKEIRNTAVIQFHKKLKQENLTECYKHDYCKYCEYCPIFNSYLDDSLLKKSEILCEDAKAYQKAVLYLKNKDKQV